MNVFHFAEFGNLTFVYHTIDTYLGIQWTITLSSEKPDSILTNLLGVTAIMGIPVHIKTDNAHAHVLCTL